MLSTIQLIVHLPLLAIPFPGNARYAFGLIVALANSKLIPVDKLLNKLGMVTSKANEMGYSDNLFYSMGLPLILIILLSILALMGFILKKKIKSSFCLGKFLTTLGNKVVFNSFLRTFIQQYLSLNLAAFYALKGT